MTPLIHSPLFTNAGFVDDRAEEGVRLPGQMPTPSVRLTPRESEVLRLAAQGHSIREIAQTPYVSPRTVETHLLNVFEKMRLDPPPGGGAGVREPRRTPPTGGPVSSSADEPRG
jgi:DNA-binding CsgD family transcriptional regulator